MCWQRLERRGLEPISAAIWAILDLGCNGALRVAQTAILFKCPKCTEWSKRVAMNRERPSASAKKRQRRLLPAPKPSRLRPFPISWDEWEKAAAAGNEIIRAELEWLKRGEAEIARRNADGRWP